MFQAHQHRWLNIFLGAICLLAAGCGSLRRGTHQDDELKEDPINWFALLKEKGKELGPFPPPSQERRWRPDLAVLPSADFNGNKIVIHDVRNCRYRTESDYDVRHYDLSFDLQDVRTVDFIVVPFKDAPILAHTMLSYGLADERHFVISVEARLEQGENYTPRGGSLRQYELMYVIADEQDIIPLRTEVRDVDVYLYRGNAQPDQVQDMLVDMLHRVNHLAREPEYYDTLTNNCTTNIVDHVNRLRPGTIRLDPRVLLPGHSDRLAYELGLIQVNGSFEETRVHSKINILSHLYYDDPKYSSLIRQGKTQP